MGDTCPAVANITDITRYMSTLVIETMLVNKYKNWISIGYTDNLFEPSLGKKKHFP